MSQLNTSYHVLLVVTAGSKQGEFQEHTLANVTATTGKQAVLECLVVGNNDTPTITWTPFPNDSKVNMKGQGGILTFNNVTVDHEGVYTCSFNQTFNGRNVHGERQFYLTVIG